MRKGRKAGTLILSLLTAIIFIASMGSVSVAATVNWTLPSTYTNGNPIPAADQARIEVGIFTGPSATGPWTQEAVSAPGATTGQAPNPTPGGTLWYTIDARLDGKTSAKATAKSLSVDFLTPDAPQGLTVTFP